MFIVTRFLVLLLSVSFIFGFQGVRFHFAARMSKKNAMAANLVEELLKNYDKPITPFEKKVYEFCASIPKGKVATYGEMAKAMGHPKAFRAVGTALRKNPFAPTVPCHRVVAADLSLGGFSGSKDPCGPNLKRKVALLEDEGVTLERDEQEDHTKPLKELPTTKRLKISKSSVHYFK